MKNILVTEFLGTAFLLIAVVGSGIMEETLSRLFMDTIAEISPNDVPMYFVWQLLGALLAVGVSARIFRQLMVVRS